MKLAAVTKKPPANPPSRCAEAGDEVELFFSHVVKAAGVGRKELVYDLRVSKTLVDLWLSGEKNDPFTQARRAAAVFLRKGRADLIPAILLYVAGGEDFDGAVLSAEQAEALRTLAKAVSGSA